MNHHEDKLQITQIVTSAFFHVLTLDTNGSVPELKADTPFEDLGIDSLTLAAVLSKIEINLEVELQPEELIWYYESSTIAELIDVVFKVKTAY